MQWLQQDRRPEAPAATAREQNPSDLFRDGRFDQLLPAAGRGVVISTIVGLAFGGAMAAIRLMNPGQFDRLVLHVSPLVLGGGAFLVTLAAQLAAAAARGRL
jgi:hypothetical protein